jgi:hypothetical protein
MQSGFLAWVMHDCIASRNNVGLLQESMQMLTVFSLAMQLIPILFGVVIQTTACRAQSLT